VEPEHCQSPETLKEYALGRLADEEAEALTGHVADCPVCEETLAGFDDTADSFVGAVRDAGDDAEDISAAPDGLQAALQRIANPYDHSSTATNPVAERIRDYELLEPLGHGGMGNVYRALHRSLGRIVAVKLLPGRRLRAPQAVERFRREMKAIGRLNHPSIVRATDAGEVDGKHYLAMDYVDGIDLSRLVKLTGPLPIAAACEIIRQAAVALQCAHDQGLIHRDVKPGNLMLEAGATGHPQTSPITVKVMDLGLALFGAASEMIDELTTVGQLMGTLDYMAPEQADSSHTVGATADVYSLGATLFKLLMGKAPYETDEYRTPLKKMKALSLIDAPGISDHRADLPDDLANIVDRLLMRDANRRPQTAQEIAESLEPFCSGHQLDDLLQRGVRKHEERRIANRDDEAPAEPHAAEISPIALRNLQPNTAQQELRHPGLQPEMSRQQGGGIRRVITACAALAGITVLAAVIWLQTDKGMLKIESAGNQIPVEIRRGSEVVESLTLIAGTNQVQLRSGHYEIILPVEYDNLKVQNGSVEIHRGGNWIARVTETADKIARVTETAGKQLLLAGVDQPQENEATAELTYEGKTFDDWNRIVSTERSPEELTKAIKALCKLGRGHRDDEAVMQVVAGTDTRAHLPQHSGPRGSSGPESVLLLTSIDQLRGLQTDNVVATVAELLRHHDPNVMYFVAAFLAPQRDWYNNVFQWNYNNLNFSMRDVVPQVKAFYNSNRFSTLLEQDFELLSEELRINYLRFLTEDLYTSPITQRTDKLTLEQRAIAIAAMNEKFGNWVQDVACMMLVRREPSANVVVALVDRIRKSNTDETHNLAGNTNQHGSINWGRQHCFWWTMLRNLSDHVEAVTALSDWIREDRVEIGSLNATFRATTHTCVAGPGAGDNHSGGSGFLSPQLNVSRGNLATEILAAMGPRAADTLPALYDRIAALCGQRPIDNGKWGYESIRQTSTIPSMNSVLSGNSDEADFPSPDPSLSEFEAMIYAVQRITDAPVRFAENPKLLALHIERVTHTIHGTIPQIFRIANLNGHTWQSLQAEAESEDPITLQRIS
jgi:serine/threonine protein kinase